MLAPHLARLLSGDLSSEHFTVREVTVPPGFVGQSVEQLGRETGALVVAIWRGQQAVRGRPQETLQEGDTVLLAGAAAEVEAVEAPRSLGPAGVTP